MKSITLVFLFAVLSFLLKAQNYNLNSALNGQRINTCSGNFYDSGGASANYESNQNYTAIFCSNTIDKELKVTFQSFNSILGEGVLKIFYGTDISGTLLVSLSGNVDFNSIGNTFMTNQTDSPDGCLTFQWVSNSEMTASGWSASINCVSPCQPFTLDIQTNSDTVKICQNTEITLNTVLNFPNNNQDYNQTAENTFLNYDFGDNTPNQSGFGLTSVSHTYAQGGAILKVYATDTNGCRNSNFAKQIIMVSLTPNFSETYIDTTNITIGDSIILNGSVSSNSWSDDNTSEGNNVRLFLPDGDGATYTTSIRFDQFAQGQTLGNINNVIGICIDIEHSALADLTIWLICPSGARLDLVTAWPLPPSGNEQPLCNLGEPVDDDNSMTAGTSYSYCFTPTGNRGTMYSNSSSTTHRYTDNDGNSVDQDGYADRYYLPAGNYAAQGTWSNLRNCPLNGNWVLYIRDGEVRDNGYIFGWNINFSPAILPILWGFENSYNSSLYSWTTNIDGGTITQQNGIGSTTPIASSEIPYTFSVTDNFGCVYDTTINVRVVNTDGSVSVSYNNEISDLNIQILPNPNNGAFIIKLNEKENSNKKADVQIFDNQGKIVNKITLKNINEQFEIDLKNCSKGIYYIKVICDNHNYYKKMIVE